MQSRPGVTASPSDRATRTRVGLGSRRVRIVAFASSFVLHVIAILLYPTLVRTLVPEAGGFPVPASSSPLQGTVIIRLIEIDDSPDADRPDEPEEIEEVVAAEAETSTPVLDLFPGAELVPPGPTAVERLRPNLTDARLWAEPPPEFYELSLEQREELILADRIVEWYDSVARARTAEERLTDWTFRDSDGGRWGISDGRIHLGDISVPLPLTFGTPVGKRDETNRRLWEFDELTRQSQSFLIETSWKERSAAMRARRDKERAIATGDTTGIR